MLNATKHDKNINILIIILILITLIAVSVTIWALFFRDTTPVLVPDYAPQQIEENAIPIENDDDEKMTASNGGGAVSMTYQDKVTVSLTDNSMNLMFQNPSKSLCNMILQVIVISADGTETVIAQSNTLPPGFKLKSLDLLENSVKLSEGIYNGKFNVLYYDVDTGEKAIVNGNIENVEITVKD